MTIILLVLIILVGIIIMQSRNTQDGSIDKNKSVATIITNWLTFLSSPAKGDELLVATERPLPSQPPEESPSLPPVPLPSQPPEESPSLPPVPLPSQPPEESPSLPLVPLPSQPGEESPSLPMDPLPMPRTQVTNYPEHWGPKPSIETKDIVELPNDYGYGSSTIRAWIEYNMKRDKRRENLESAKSYEFMCMIDVMIEAIEQGNLTTEFVEKHKDIMEAITSKEMGTLQTIDHVDISTFVDDIKGKMGVKLFDIMVNVSEKYPDSLCKKELERLQVEPELPTLVDDDLTSAQDSLIDIVEDDSNTLEDKVNKITGELSVQVPDISEDDMVDIVNIVVEGEASLPVEPELPTLVDDDLTSAQDSLIDIEDESLPEERGGYNNDLQQFHSMLADGFVSSLHVEPELPTPVDDLTSAQDSLIDIVEDDSTTTEDKVIQITEELSVQVPDISEDDMVDIVNIVVEGEASLPVEPELPTPVDDLTSAQDSLIDIVEDDSTTTEDKVIQITEELSVQVPDISEDDIVDIVNTVVEGEASLQVESEFPKRARLIGSVKSAVEEEAPAKTPTPRDARWRPGPKPPFAELINSPGFRVPEDGPIGSIGSGKLLPPRKPSPDPGRDSPAILLPEYERIDRFIGLRPPITSDMLVDRHRDEIVRVVGEAIEEVKAEPVKSSILEKLIDDLTSGQDPLVDIEDNSTATEQKVIQIIKNLSKQVRGISKDDIVDIVDIVVEGEASLQVEPEFPINPKPPVTKPMPKPPVIKPMPKLPVIKPMPKLPVTKPKPKPPVTKPMPKPPVIKPMPKLPVIKPMPKLPVTKPKPKPPVTKPMPKPPVTKPNPKAPAAWLTPVGSAVERLPGVLLGGIDALPRGDIRIPEALADPTEYKLFNRFPEDKLFDMAMSSAGGAISSGAVADWAPGAVDSVGGFASDAAGDMRGMLQEDSLPEKLGGYNNDLQQFHSMLANGFVSSLS